MKGNRHVGFCLPSSSCPLYLDPLEAKVQCINLLVNGSIFRAASYVFCAERSVLLPVTKRDGTFQIAGMHIPKIDRSIDAAGKQVMAVAGEFEPIDVELLIFEYK